MQGHLQWYLNRSNYTDLIEQLTINSVLFSHLSNNTMQFFVLLLCALYSVSSAAKLFDLLISSYGTSIHYQPITKHPERDQLVAGCDRNMDKDCGEPVRFTLNDDGSLQNKDGIKVSISTDQSHKSVLQLAEHRTPTFGFSIVDGSLRLNKTPFVACPDFLYNKYENYLSIDKTCSAAELIGLLAVGDIHTATTSTPSPTILPTSN